MLGLLNLARLDRANNLGGCHYLCEKHCHVAQCGVVLRLSERRGPIRNEDDIVVVLHCIARSRFAANVGDRPGNDNGLYAARSQYFIEPTRA